MIRYVMTFWKRFKLIHRISTGLSRYLRTECLSHEPFLTDRELRDCSMHDSEEWSKRNQDCTFTVLRSHYMYMNFYLNFMILHPVCYFLYVFQAWKINCIQIRKDFEALDYFLPWSILEKKRILFNSFFPCEDKIIVIEKSLFQR